MVRRLKKFEYRGFLGGGGGGAEEGGVGERVDFQ